MKRLLSMCLLIVGGGLLGCGGGNAADIQNNAPAFSTVSMDMETADASAPGETTAALTPNPDGTCHPYLFARTRHVVHRLNWHLYKVLFAIDHVIKNHPDAQAGATATWTRSGANYTVQVKGTKVSESQYTYEVDFKAAGAPDSAYVKVMSSTVDVTAGSSGAGASESGELNIDLSALSSVVTSDHSAGTIDYKFDISGDVKNVEATVANFTPDDDLSNEISPRNAHYVFTRHNGVGGSLKYTDEMYLLCPAQTNPPERATVDTVFRWSHKSDGTIVARGDAQASGGQIPSGDKIVGLTCGTLNNGDVEKYWMMKAENSSGATVVEGSFSFDSEPGVDPTAACDAAFGAVPSTSDSSSDYDFTKVDFSSSDSVSYPGA